MKRTACLIAVIAGSVVCSALGAFIAPTQQQILAAANDPATLSALLKDATPNDAATMAVSIFEAITSLSLSHKEEKNRIAAVVKILFQAFPNQANQLAAELGDHMALIPRGSKTRSAVSVVQRTIIEAAGAPAGLEFANAFKDAPTPPPPIGTGYKAQKLK